MRFKNALGDSGRGKRLNTDLGVSRQVRGLSFSASLVMMLQFTLARQDLPVSLSPATSLEESSQQGAYIRVAPGEAEL